MLRFVILTLLLSLVEFQTPHSLVHCRLAFVNEREGNKMEQQLQENFLKIQLKIEAIFDKGELHVKQISDLERYIGMQSDIVKAIAVMKKVN